MNRREIKVERELRRQTWHYTIAAGISLAGLADAIFLTVEHLTGSNLTCVVTAGCSEVLGSQYAVVHGVPIAALGALAYFSAFSTATLAAFGYRWAGACLVLLIGPMLGTTLWLLYVQAFVLHAFCDYCLLSAAFTFALVALIIAQCVGSPSTAVSV
jgi:uncharacterized membrane protein